jgi:hypothetical protein
MSEKPDPKLTAQVGCLAVVLIGATWLAGLALVVRWLW